MTYVSVADFDPNKPSKGRQPIWGVYDGVRFKTFGSRGPALNKVKVNYAAKLYEFINGVWVERAHKRQSPGQVCDNCQGTVMGPNQRYDYQQHVMVEIPGRERNWGTWEWTRERGKITDPPQLLWVCRDCAPALRHG